MMELNVMLIGDTRVGKTSFVNPIVNRRDWKRVGGDNGESTTAGELVVWKDSRWKKCSIK